MGKNRANIYSIDIDQASRVKILAAGVLSVKNKFKLFYFMQFLSAGVFGPYFALYLYQNGFSGGQIGLLLGTMPIVVMLAQPVWSYFSDIFQTRRNILVISSIAMGGSILAIGYSETFTSVYVYGIIFAIFRAPMQPIGNALVLDFLEEERTPEKFGFLRLWGSLSFAISSVLIGGFLIEDLLSYLPWILFAMYIGAGVSSYLLPEKRGSFRYSMAEGLRFLPSNPEFLLFLIGSIFIGASLGVVMNYQALFLGFLGASPWLIGIVVSLPALLEIPLMLVVPSLLRRFSWSIIILVGAIALPVRWLCYMFIQNPVWVIPTQLLHSIAIVSFMVVGVSLVNKKIHQKWRATSQGLYSASLDGVGSGIGIFLAGYVMELFGVRAIWSLNLGLGLIGLAIVVLALKRFDVKETLEFEESA